MTNLIVEVSKYLMILDPQLVLTVRGLGYKAGPAAEGGAR